MHDRCEMLAIHAYSYNRQHLVASRGRRRPITVLTGFLGAGKTTLLNCLLKQPDLANTAILINGSTHSKCDLEALARCPLCYRLGNLCVG